MVMMNWNINDNLLCKVRHYSKRDTKALVHTNEPDFNEQLANDFAKRRKQNNSVSVFVCRIFAHRQYRSPRKCVKRNVTNCRCQYAKIVKAKTGGECERNRFCKCPAKMVWIGLIIWYFNANWRITHSYTRTRTKTQATRQGKTRHGTAKQGDTRTITTDRYQWVCMRVCDYTHSATEATADSISISDTIKRPIWTR